MDEAVGARTGGRILVDALIAHGASHVFCVPGESYLAALDALYDARNAIRTVTCRQEGGAANMADAYAKLTGKPGICFVTRGPGACNASIGVHTAAQDSTPMILFVGQVARPMFEREAFQEIDLKAMFGWTAKWAADIHDPARIPEMVARAFRAATSGRPGPVVLGLPEDMLIETAICADAKPAPPVVPHPAPDAMARMGEMLAGAERPLAILGGGTWTPRASAEIQAFAEGWRLPCAVSFRAADCLDNLSPAYVGDLGAAPDPALSQRVREADLLLVIGPRLGELTTQGYELLTPPNTDQTLIHVHPGAEELGRVYQPDLAILSAMTPFAEAARALPPPAEAPWRDWAAAIRTEHEAWRATGSCPGPLDMVAVMATLAERLPRDAIVASDAGNFSGWVQRFWRFSSYRSALGSTAGAMGYGIPAGVAAGIAAPERLTLCVCGDGGFMMAAQEIATAIQERAKLLILVVDNGLYGTIRMHQEREYPERPIATNLANPDFAAFARSFGAWGGTAERTEEFAPLLDKALAHDGPALIALKLDPEAITTRMTLSEIRDAALARARG